MPSLRIATHNLPVVLGCDGRPICSSLHSVHALLQRERWIQLQHLGGPGVDEHVTRRGKVDFAGAGDTAPAPTRWRKPSTTFNTQPNLEVATQPSNEPCSVRLESPSASASSTTESWTRTIPWARPASNMRSCPKATRGRYTIGVVPIGAPTALSALNTHLSGSPSGAPFTVYTTRACLQYSAQIPCIRPGRKPPTPPSTLSQALCLMRHPDSGEYL